MHRPWLFLGLIAFVVAFLALFSGSEEVKSDALIRARKAGL